NARANWEYVLVGDFNGDHASDIAGFEAGVWWVTLSPRIFPVSPTLSSIWTIWSTAVTWVDVHAGDFNNDGLDDIVGRAKEIGQWWVGLSNGSSFMNQFWTVWSTAVDWVDVKVGDLNGDGLPDIAGRTASGGQWWVALSDGSQFTNYFWGSWNPAATWVD